MMRLFYLIVTGWLFISQPAQAVSLPVPSAEGQKRSTKEWVAGKSGERKGNLREARKMIRTLRKEWKKKYDEDEDRTVLLAVISIFLPFLAVYLKEGEITEHFWISLLLSLVFWVPGVVYALLIVFDIIG